MSSGKVGTPWRDLLSLDATTAAKCNKAATPQIVGFGDISFTQALARGWVFC